MKTTSHKTSALKTDRHRGADAAVGKSACSKIIALGAPHGTGFRHAGQRSSTQPRTANTVNFGTGSWPLEQTKIHTESRNFSKTPSGDETKKIPCEMAESWNHKIRSDPPSWEVKLPEHPFSGRKGKWTPPPLWRE